MDVKRSGLRIAAFIGVHDIREQARVAALASGAVLLVMIGAAVVGVLTDEPYRVLTREPVEQFAPDKPYAGVLAHLTWFLWVGGGTAAVLTAAVLYRVAPEDRRVGFLLTSALLTTALLADDFLLLHDWVLPRIGMPEEVLYLGYAIGFVVLLWRFRPEFAEADVLVAAAAGALWAVSLGADFLQEHFNVQAHALEDGAKMVGTALWATFLVRRSLRVLDVERPEQLGPRARTG